MAAKHPTTVAQLSQIVYSENGMDESDFIRTVKAMVEDGSISLQAPRYEMESILDYLFSPALSFWFWAILAGSAVALVAITLTPDVYPVNVLRWVSGSIFVLYLPGYALLKFLLQEKTELGGLERIALSIALSIVAVFLVGVLINFSPWGLRLVPILVSFGGFTILCAIGAALRQYLALQ